VRFATLNIGKMNALVRQLEHESGLAQSGPYFTLRKAQARLEFLQAAVEQRKTTSSGRPVVHVEKSSKPKVAPVAPSASLPASSSTPCLDKWRRENAASAPPSRGKMLAVIATVFPSLDTHFVSDCTDAELWESIQRQAWICRLQVPGLPSDSVMQAKGYKRLSDERQTGTGRIIRALRQARLNNIFGNHNPK